MAQRFLPLICRSQRPCKAALSSTALNERLQQDEALVASISITADIYADLRPAADPPNFESRPLRTFNSEMPEGFGVDEFVTTW